jgi:hypothetical protein
MCSYDREPVADAHAGNGREIGLGAHDHVGGLVPRREPVPSHEPLSGREPVAPH